MMFVRCVALVALLALGCRISGADEGGKVDDFDALVAARGADYEARRDALLAGDQTALRARLGPLANDAQPRRAATAQILTGWLDHGPLYRDVLQRIEQVDVQREGRKVTGIAGVWDRFADAAANEWGAPVLPLAWEIVLARTDWPSWKVATGLHMIGAVPDARSVPVLIEFIEHTEDDGLRRLASQILGRMPPAAAREPVERARRRSAGIADALGKAGEQLGGSGN